MAKQNQPTMILKNLWVEEIIVTPVDDGTQMEDGIPAAYMIELVGTDMDGDLFQLHVSMKPVTMAKALKDVTAIYVKCAKLTGLA